MGQSQCCLSFIKADSLIPNLNKREAKGDVREEAEGPPTAPLCIWALVATATEV